MAQRLFSGFGSLGMAQHSGMGWLSLGVIAVGLLLVWPLHVVTWAAELQQFTLETAQNGELTVRLQTNGPVTPNIQYSERGASIQLSGASLSNNLVERGLPVVIDNRNTTIGRAVPQEDGSVAIVLPNVAKGADIRVVQTQQPLTPNEGLTPAAKPTRVGGQFSAALEAAKASLVGATSKPAQVTHVSPSARSLPIVAAPAVASPPDATPSLKRNTKNRSPKPSVTLSPAPTRTRKLPKVVPLKPAPVLDEPTLDESGTPPLSANGASSSGAPSVVVVQQPAAGIPSSSGYAADTSWFQTEQLPEWAGNEYGVLGVDETVDLTTPAPEPKTDFFESIFTGFSQFLDRISGNLFSRPYGFAFWGMVMAVVLLAGVGFVLLAFGILVARVAFRPSAFIPSKTQEYPVEYSHGLPQANPMDATLAKYIIASGKPSVRPPFRGSRPVAPAPQPLGPASKPRRTSLWQRIQAQPQPVQASSPAAAYTPTPPMVVQQQHGYSGHQAKSTSVRQRIKQPVATVPLPKTKGFGGVAKPPVSPQRKKTVQDAVNTVLQWV